MHAHRSALGPLWRTVAFLAVIGAACGSDAPSDADRIEAVAADLVADSDGALTDDQATCVAQAVVSALGERADDVLRRAVSDEVPELRKLVADAFATCDALEPFVGD